MRPADGKNNAVVGLLGGTVSPHAATVDAVCISWLVERLCQLAAGSAH